MADSFSSSAELNELDWRRAQRLSALVDHYRTLIRLRRDNPVYFGGPRMVADRGDAAVVFRVGNDVIAINPLDRALDQPTEPLEVAGPYDEVAQIAPNGWVCVYCAGAERPAAPTDRRLTLPPLSYSIWRRA